MDTLESVNNAISTQNYTQAIELLNKLIATLPSSEAYHTLGMVYFEIKDIQKSIDSISNAISLDKSNEVYFYNLALAYFSINDFEKAIENLNSAIAIKSSFSMAYNLLGISLQKVSKLYEAEKAFASAIKSDANNAQANLNLARLLKDIGDYNRAISQYRFYMDLSGDNAYVYLELAYVYKSIAQYNEALECYTKAIELDEKLSNDTFVKNSISQIYTNILPNNNIKELNNHYKLDIYTKAIDKYSSKDSKLLQIEPHLGMLSLICAKKGFDTSVISDDYYLLEQIDEVAQSNNITNINLFKGQNEEIIEKNWIQKNSIDILVAEVFHTLLPTNKELLKIKYLKKELLTDSAKIFPSVVKLYAKVIESNELLEFVNFKNYNEIDTSILNNLKPLYIHKALKAYEYKELSSAIEVQSFILGIDDGKYFKKEINFETTNSGNSDFVVVWQEFIIDDTLVIDELAYKKEFFIYPLNKQIVEKNKTYTLSIEYPDMPLFEIKG